MCCNQNGEIRSASKISLDPGVNEVKFKVKGVEMAFRNKEYAFVPYNIEGADIFVGEQFPDKILITCSNSCKISYIAHNDY